MRMGIVIIVLAAMGVGLVQIRRQEMTARHEIQSLRAAQVKIRRTLWEQQVRMGELTAPQAVRRRAAEMALGLIDRSEAVHRMAENKDASQPPWER